MPSIWPHYGVTMGHRHRTCPASSSTPVRHRAKGCSVPDRPTGPLSGLLVADFSRVLAGPYATMLLADLGADVIKVEAPVGDDTRAWTPPTRDRVSTYYLAVNRNKRSVTLDLKDDIDVVLARELAGRADVMIENLRPGGLDRFGLGYDDVAAANPVSSTPRSADSGPRNRDGC